MSLIVDGKTVDTKPLKVAADPDVALTAIQRKQLFDMAMEMHQLQRYATDASTAFAPDVKASFDAFNKEVIATAAKFPAAAAGGRGGGGAGRGGAGANESVVAKITQAKNGLMGSMWPGDQTMKAYADAKTQVPKAIADLNALFARAATLSATLEKHKLTLTAPRAVTVPGIVAGKAADKKR